MNARKIIPLFILLSGCPKPPTPPIPPDPNVCSADIMWVTAPKQPNEVPEAESFCDFYQFSWQWFLAQTSPSVSVPNERVFEMQRVWSKEYGQNQCSEVRTGREESLNAMQARIMKIDDMEDIQADTNALYDQNGNILFYNVWYSPQMCNATQEGFVGGTFEIKASWKTLEQPDEDYFYIQSTNKEGEIVYLGMVGMHMAIWTPKHPEMIWVTWEHKDNSPLCDGSDSYPEDGWNFASKEASNCLETNKDISKCSEFAFNVPETYKDHPPLTSKPNETCREFPFGNQVGESVNGNDNNENLKAIAELNNSLVGDMGILTNLPENHPMHVWSNYEMIGGLWTKDGQNSGKLPVDSKQGPADPNSPQRGSLELTNMTMETFEQGADSYIPNCFGCHNYDSTTPLKVSHIESYLLPIYE